MASKNQLTGMQGVYLVAAELSRHGFIASPTSRSTRGADILVTDQQCVRAFSVQVKTNAGSASFWLMNDHTKEMVSSTHVYVFVNLNESRRGPDFYIVPSTVVAKKMLSEKSQKGKWHSFMRNDANPYKRKWSIFGKINWAS